MAKFAKMQYLKFLRAKMLKIQQKLLILAPTSFPNFWHQNNVNSSIFGRVDFKMKIAYIYFYMINPIYSTRGQLWNEITRAHQKIP